MADIKLNGASISTFNGKSYVLYKIVQPSKYTNIVGEIPEAFVGAFSFAPTDLIFSGNIANSPVRNLGMNWNGLGILGKVHQGVPPELYGRHLRGPSIFAGNNQGVNMVWYCYRLIENTDKDTVPPLVNVYNGNGDVSFSSKLPSLVINRFLTVPDSNILSVIDNPNSINSWRGSYDPSKETLLLGAALGFTGKTAILHAVVPGFNSSGQIWLGIGSSLGAAQQTDKIKREVIHNNIAIGLKPSAAEIAKIPVWNGGKDPIIGGAIT